MKTLCMLWLLKIKGQIRNIFRKPSSAIFTVIIVLLYGFIFSSLLFMPSDGLTVNVEMHTSITLLVALLALLMFSTMMNSHKALFYGEDAYYLFAGPFSKKQINAYFVLYTSLTSLGIALFALLFFVGFSSSSMTPMFALLITLSSALTIMTFSVLTDYIYILSITDRKYNILSKIIPAIFLLFVFVIIGLVYMKSGYIETLLVDFMMSPLFYYVPVFGWLKLALIGYASSNMMMTLSGIGLLIAGFVVVCLLFITFKGDYYEQALEDAIEFTKKYKLAKAGNQDAFKKVKVKENIKGSFYDGAYAVLSKNILLMKKSGQFITFSDILSLAIYIGITIFSNFGIGFFIYFMVLYVFSQLQNGELAKELKNYQIYLIPDHPLKKLIAVMLPAFIKITITTAIGFIIVGIYYHSDIMTIVSYVLNVIGYICIFMSGTVLSLRLLKSRSSKVFENIMAMFIMILSALPSVIVTVLFIVFLGSYQYILLIMSITSVVMNIVIGGIIILACQDMMNGRELKSE